MSDFISLSPVGAVCSTCAGYEMAIFYMFFLFIGCTDTGSQRVATSCVLRWFWSDASQRLCDYRTSRLTRNLRSLSRSGRKVVL